MPALPETENRQMIHEMKLEDRLRASISNPRPPVQERMTCEREAKESDSAAIAKERSCSVCGDPEDYCAPCSGCGKPFCENHRSFRSMCLACELEMAAESAQ